MRCVAFGAGTQGQLGNCSLKDSLLPVSVSINATGRVVDVACGGNHSLCIIACPSGPQQLFVWGLDHLHNAPEHKPKSLITEDEPQGIYSDTPEVSKQGAHSLAAGGGGSSSSGPAISTAPRQVPLPLPGAKVSRIAAGWAHTLLVTECGSLFVAGDNSFGQLGLGQHEHTTHSGFRSLRLNNCVQKEPLYADTGAAAAAADLSWQVVDVAAGMRHSLVLLHSNMTGSQQQQQCGELGVSLFSDCRQQSVGMDYTALVGFGSNKHEQVCQHDQLDVSYIGNHANMPQLPVTKRRHAVVWTPCLLRSWRYPSVRKLIAGGDRSAAITDHWQLLLWGRPLPDHPLPKAVANSAGQPTQTRRNVKVEQQLTPTITQSTGTDLSVASQNAEVPQQSVGPAAQPATLPGHMPQQWVDVQLGWRHLVCLDAEGQVWTAGDNSLGQLGVALVTMHDKETGGLQQDSQNVQRPVCCSSLAGQEVYLKLHLVPLPTRCAGIAAGSEHCAVVLQDGLVFTWGWGEHGQLGTGNTDDCPAPQIVGEGLLAHRVACGSGFTVVWMHD